MKTLKEIEKRKKEILKESEAEGVDIEKLNALNKEMDELNAAAEELRKKAAEEAEQRAAIAAKVGAEKTPYIVIQQEEPKKAVVEQRGTMTLDKQLDSVEYRSAFMNFARTGQMAEEFRAVAMTSGNSAVIPSTVLNQIVEKLESYGNILPLVSRIRSHVGTGEPRCMDNGECTGDDGRSGGRQDNGIRHVRGVSAGEGNRAFVRRTRADALCI